VGSIPAGRISVGISWISRLLVSPIGDSIVPRFQLLLDRVQDGMLVATNCSDEDIPVGTALTILYAHKVGYVGRKFESQPHGTSQVVSLTIDSVEKYKRLDCVPRGCSAGIRVVGSGLDLIQRQLSASGKDIQLFLGGDCEPGTVGVAPNF
jgi:hypothetical protein